MQKIKIILILVGLCSMLSCVKDRNFLNSELDCSEELVANSTYTEVKNLYVDETVQIQEELIIEGYVISSDKAGNFFSVLYFQDSPENPKEGFQIEIDVRDSHLFYPVGSRIFIKLKGLYLGKSKDVFKVGATFNSFGNVSVGRLPANSVKDHIFVSCDEKTTIVPVATSIEELDVSLTNTLVQLSSTEFIKEAIGQPFALEREETERILSDCDDNEIVLVNSGFSDFYEESLPDGNGAITGVLLRENSKYTLAIRDLDDVDFTNERCEELVDEFTSTTILISEIADPDNNTGARFLELYNSATTDLSLNGWSLRRYTNANIEINSTIDLSALVIEGESTLVISPNEEEFERVYGFLPDLGVGTNTAADSNGDDNLELVDPFGTVIDVYGIIGEDGTGTDHEFEDGRALRNIEISKGNSTYTFSEWVIYNDTGDSGTINRPQMAPDDFSPNSRN